jgi:hypothetical protein
VVSILCFVLFVSLSSAAHAQTLRWVSAVGSDASSCSRAAPCQTFAEAINKSADGGFIGVVDPGGFGGATITRSITIDGVAQHAGVLGSGGNAVVINAPGKRVVLRNLAIQSPTPPLGEAPPIGQWGIRVLAAAEVHLENVVISGFGSGAVEFDPSGGAEGSFNNVSLINNSGFGILVRQGRVTASGLLASSNPQAVYVYGTAIATVRDCYSSGGSQGFRAGLAGAILNIDNCTITHNGQGLWADSGATIRVSNSMIVSNTGSGLHNNGGTFVSLGGNAVAGNSPEGSFNSTIAKQ